MTIQGGIIMKLEDNLENFMCFISNSSELCTGKRCNMYQNCMDKYLITDKKEKEEYIKNNILNFGEGKE